MKITHIDVHEVAVVPPRSWVFVRTHTDDGHSGLGEMNPSAPRQDCLAALRAMAATLAGEDPRRIEALRARLLAPATDPAVVQAFSALEQSLWDLLGKSLDCPVHVLFGGPCDEAAHLYANITRATLELTPAAFAASAAGATADGFDGLKLAPFGGPVFEADRAAGLANGIDCVRAVREAAGPRVDLMLDCYGILTVAEALQVAAAVADLDLFWLEEPVAEDDVEGYRRVKGETGLRLAGGERFVRREGFWSAIAADMMDVIMPDATICGGLGELRKIADMAAARGQQVAPHGPFGPVLVAAQAQAMLSHPAFLRLEYAWPETPWRHDFVHPAERVDGSRLRLSGAPGIGLELDLEAVAAHPHEVSLDEGADRTPA